MLSKKTIRENTYDTVYRRGVGYYEEDRVTKLTVTPQENRRKTGWNTLVEALVRGSGGKVYETSLLLSEDEEIIDSGCTCPFTYYGLCKHAVAVGLAYRDEQEKMFAPGKQADSVLSARTDYALSKVLEGYAGKKQGADVSQPPVRLECWFTGTNSKLTLECRIGRKRMLIVKNLLQLVRNVQLQAEYQYGTTLSFRHTLSAFDADSQAILKALEKNVMDRMVSFTDSATYEYTNSYRSMDFFGTPLERLLTPFLGKTVKLNEKDIPVIDGNPPVTFELAGNGALAVFTGPAMGLFECGGRCFALYRNKLWYCTPEFTARVLPLLELFRDKSSFYGKKQEKKYTLSQQDYTAFCGNVLPSLEGLAEVKATGFSLGDWAPPEPMFSIYLHKAGEDTIAATASVAYGKEERDLLLPGQDKTGWHDPLEEEVRRCVEQYFPEPMEQARAAEYDAFILGDQAADAPEEDAVRVKPAGKMTLCARGNDAIWQLLNGGLGRLSSLAEVYVDDAIRRMQVRPAPTVNIGVSLSGGLLNLDVQVDQLDMEEIAGILAGYRARRKYHRLKNGDFMELGDSGLSVLSELAEGMLLPETALKEGHVELPAYRAMYVDGVLSASQGVRFSRSRDFKQMIREIQDFRNGEYNLPPTLRADLRPYQADGYQWLCALYDLKLGGILADDMGLGKTVQMIALFRHAADQEPSFSALVIAPTSLLYNWESEVRRFAPDLTAQIIAGTAGERAELIPDCPRYNVNITSYDLFKRDVEAYENMDFSCLVLDEAQYIKNAATKAAKSIEHLRAAHRFAMTGTPVENRLSDLWSIFNCVMPGYLYTYPTFRKEMEQPIAKEDDEAVRQRLSRMVSPFLLRRKKADVLKDLPDKLEENLFIQMSGEQEKLYQANQQKLIYDLARSDAEEVRRDRMRILAALTRLRQICCSPALCYEDYKGGSGKVDACLETLHNAVSAGHRVLVFSQFTSMLELLIAQWDGDCLYLSGKDNKQQRKEMVERFQTGQVPVFFISLKAGGTGLNLTQADTVIHCDPWWNVAAQNQATDRAHRIGQKNTVNVLRLVARNTIEEKIIALQERKSALADAVVSGQGTDEFTLDKEELMALFSDRADGD